MALWSRFGDKLVKVDADEGLESLGLYGGRGADGTARLLVVNPTGTPFGATIAADPVATSGEVRTDEVVADSLLAKTVTWNGSATPSIALDEPGRTEPLSANGEVHHDFPAFSITLLSWEPTS